MLNEIKDSAFFNNTFSTAYTEANARGVFAKANANVISTTSPIVSITRGPTVSPTATLRINPVTNLDPRAAGDAVNAALVAPAPNDGFFQASNYRGAFSPTVNWLCDWTAADAFGMTNPTAGQCPTETNCPADLNGDGQVNASDLCTLLSLWGTAGGIVTGKNTDGVLSADDLASLLATWGSCE